MACCIRTLGLLPEGIASAATDTLAGFNFGLITVDVFGECLETSCDSTGVTSLMGVRQIVDVSSGSSDISVSTGKGCCGLFGRSGVRNNLRFYLWICDDGLED